MGFQQGLSGLNAADKNLQVIGNNVANSSTVGFKSSRVQFADVYANSIGGGTQIGIGTTIGSVNEQYSQGNITTTNNPLDIAINGQGFFRVSQGNTISYTRDGQFQLNKDGYVVNSLGQFLTGYSAVNGVVTPGALGNLKVSSANLSPRATTTTSVGANLSSSATPPTTTPFNSADPTSYNFSTPETLYDSLGQSHAATFYFVNVASNTWNVYTNVDGVSADPVQTAATQLSAAQATATSVASGFSATAAQINAITGSMVSGTTSAQMAAAASTAATTAGLSAAQAASISSAVALVPDILTPVQTVSTQLTGAQSMVAAAASGFGATTTQTSAMTGSMVSGTTPAQMGAAVQAVATGPGGLNSTQAASISSVLSFIPDSGAVMTPATQLSSIQSSVTAAASGFGATTAQINAITTAINNASPPTSASYATAAQTAAGSPGGGLTVAQAASIQSVVSLIPNTGITETATNQVTGAQALATAAANAFGATAAQVTAITTAISGAAPATTSALASAASTAATGQGMTVDQAAAIAAAVNTIPNALASQTAVTQLSGAQTSAAALATAFGSTAAQNNVITSAIAAVPPATTASLATIASATATAQGLTPSQSAAIAAAASDIPDSGATQTAANQAAKAQSTAAAMATAFGANATQSGAISSAIVAGQTSAQMAAAAQTAATGPGGLNSTQAAALSSIVGLIPASGSVQTAVSQLTEAQGSASAMANAFGANAAQISAITTAIVSGQTSAQMASAAQTAALGAGLTNAQAQAISSVVTLVPNVAKASAGPSPSMLQFSTGGAVLSGANAPTNTSKTITLANGASPLAFAVDFSQMTQYGGNFGTNSLSQDGYSAGQLSSFSIGADGTISGSYSNGQTKALGQVSLANFTNPNGLKDVGNNQYNETLASGSPLIGPPGSSSLGVLQSSAVENSNVDLTAELVNLISAQRTYQANAQSIKAEDTVLQTIVSGL